MGKKSPLDRTPNQSSFSARSIRAEFDKVIEQRPLDQRPKVAPHPYVRFETF